ncbi:MAG: hypothetical protein ACFFDP_10780 [Promethearchaeota archaeon]
MKTTETNAECLYKESDLPQSWAKMTKFALEGGTSWIRVSSLIQYRLEVLCCLAVPCKTEQCELDRNAVVWLGKNSKRKGVFVAIQTILEPKKRIFFKGEPNKTFWVPPYSGRFFQEGRTHYGKTIDVLQNIENCLGIEIKVGYYMICDNTLHAERIKVLRKKKRWGLEKENDAVYGEVTGVPK